ncbi:MAG: hypothetical protein K0U68_01355 [Gammaproteobacteria bacterium]|nr:hypothetical protein [Gammaproteobacteria bacterium]
MGNKIKKFNQRKHKQSANQSVNKRRRQLHPKVWEQLLESKIDHIEYPGGRSRKTCRLHLTNGSAVIASQRNSQKHLNTEATVLKTVGDHGGNVPRLIKSDHKRLLVQQNIDGIRLSQALQTDTTDYFHQLLSNTIESLATIQKIGSDYQLDQELSVIGNHKQWIIDLLNRPAVIGHHFKCPAPMPELDKLLALFTVKTPRFVKWDARPGNAIVRADKKVLWFDWEHAGTRNRLDDLVWLLGDEFVANYPDLETRMLDDYLPEFADHFSLNKARDYFYAFGVFHSTVRLGLILSNKGNKPWWNLQYCLDGDKVGVTLDQAQSVCLRASRWSQQTGMTKCLAPWFVEISDILESL